MNFHVEIREKFGVEVDIKIQWLVEKDAKTIFLKPIFIPVLKLKIFLETIFGKLFHIDFINGITIEFPFKNNGEIWCWIGCENPIFRWKTWKKLYSKTRFSYPF